MSVNNVEFCLFRRFVRSAGPGIPDGILVGRAAGGLGLSGFHVFAPTAADRGLGYWFIRSALYLGATGAVLGAGTGEPGGGKENGDSDPGLPSESRTVHFGSVFVSVFVSVFELEFVLEFEWASW